MQFFTTEDREELQGGRGQEYEWQENFERSRSMVSLCKP